VSLFSGCGGLDLGVQQAGFEIVFATDHERRCAESHGLNFSDALFHLESVVDLDGPRIIELTDGRAECPDLLVGGPPCPPFSKSRFYRKEKPRALADDIAWETLTGYVRVLRDLKPRAFILENVPGLAYKVHADAMSFLQEQVSAARYKTTWRILNAADYGVPQIRERFFMVGVRDGVFEFPSPTHAKSRDSLLTAELLPWRTAGEAIGDLDTEESADDTGHFAGGQFHHLLREVPPGDNYLYFTAKRGYAAPKFEWRSRYWSFLLKLSPDLPSWTIQARRSNNMGPFHWRNRILRIEEIKRLQTFPDEWQLAGTVEAQWRQVGNAVPPMLAQAIASSVRDHIARRGTSARKAA
jgi:DNA (cytosine-5)-methyltransferase 1